MHKRMHAQTRTRIRTQAHTNPLTHSEKRTHKARIMQPKSDDSAGFALKRSELNRIPEVQLPSSKLLKITSSLKD
jgi:hypothetical protein